MDSTLGSTMRHAPTENTTTSTLWDFVESVTKVLDGLSDATDDQRRVSQMSFIAVDGSLQHESRRVLSWPLSLQTIRRTVCWPYCEGCDIVQSDHAPQAGVAQGIFNGDLIRRRVGHQVELEEELDEEVERRVRRDHSRDNTQVRMHG